jgi:acyl-CoA thioester hydrolase
LKEFIWSVRVYYEDTDAGGVVYHSQYLNYMERARTEFLRHEGFMQTNLRDEMGILFVVRDMHVRYRKPARFDDYLQIRTRLKEVRRSLLIFEQDIYRQTDLITLASAEVVCIDAKTFKPTAIPDKLLAQFK